MKFQESAYQFQFYPEWLIIKFDDHQFYKVLSGQSLSGVDFSGIYCDTLYLMEVKNYQTLHEETEPIKADQLIHDLNEKLTDSIKIIEIINKYFDQKKSYQFFSGIIDKLPFLNRDWYYWRRVKEAILKNKKLQFVLFIDGFNLPQDALQKLKQELDFYKEKIRVEWKIKTLSDSNDLIPKMEWEVIK